SRNSIRVFSSLFFVSILCVFGTSAVLPHQSEANLTTINMDPPIIYGTNPPLLESYNASSYRELFRLSTDTLKTMASNRNLWLVPDMATLMKHNPNIWLDVGLCFAGALAL